MPYTPAEARELRRVVRREAREALAEVARVAGECGELCEVVTGGEMAMGLRGRKRRKGRSEGGVLFEAVDGGRRRRRRVK